MVDEGKSGMQCEEFEALLAEAIDGTLSGQRREEFERHRAGCAACNTLLAEVSKRRGVAGRVGGCGASAEPGAQHSGR